MDGNKAGVSVYTFNVSGTIDVDEHNLKKGNYR